MRLLIRLTRETRGLIILFFMIMTALRMVSDGDLSIYGKTVALIDEIYDILKRWLRHGMSLSSIR